MCRNVRKGGRGLAIAVARTLVDRIDRRVSAAVGRVVVAVRVAEGDAAGMRDGVADVVAPARVVVRAGID